MKKEKRGMNPDHIQHQHLWNGIREEPIIAYAWGEIGSNGKLMGYAGSSEFVETVAVGRKVRVRLEVLR